MKTSFGTTARDASASRRETFKNGERDGTKQYPAITPDGNTVVDYETLAHEAEAETSAQQHTASYFDTDRVALDDRLGVARSTTASRTTRARDARLENEEDKAELAAVKNRLPLSARFYLPKPFVAVFLLLLGLGSAWAVTAALLGATEDSEWLSYGIGAAVAVATIGAAYCFGILLRRRDLDDIKDGKYASSGPMHWLVFGLVLLGGLGLALGVAGLRKTASEHDAYRQAKQTTIDILIPNADEPPADASADQPAAPDGVSFWIWLAFEFGLFAVASGIEYLRADARGEHLAELDQNEKHSRQAWSTAHQLLADAVGQHEAAVAARADHDTAVVLSGNSQRTFADVLSADHRHGNLYNRGQVGDPFEPHHEHPRLAIDEAFDLQPGQDTLALAIDKEDHNSPGHELPARDRELIDAGYTELALEPARPKRLEDEPYRPGAYLDLDNSVKALRDAQTESTQPVVDVARAEAEEPVESTVVPDFVPADITTSNNGNGS